MNLLQLKYGAVIKYRRKLWVKSKGICGDIMADVNTGHWVFIEGAYKGDWHTVNWKSFKILFNP